MKKLNILCLILVCFFMTACSNEFARQEYDSDQKISQIPDHYAKEKSSSRSANGEYSLTVSKFQGRETIWKKTLKKDQIMETGISLQLLKGKAKVVHIDRDGIVTTMLECTPDTSAEEAVTKTIALKKGQNRLKIVGYDCEDMKLKLTSVIRDPASGDP